MDFFNQHGFCGAHSSNGVIGACRKIGESAGTEQMTIRTVGQIEFTFEDVEKALSGRGREGAPVGEFGGHLGKIRAQLWTGVHDEFDSRCTRQWAADEGGW